MSDSPVLSDVTNARSFLEFAKALLADRTLEVVTERGNPTSPFPEGRSGWVNGSIEAFLEAAIRWAEDSNFGERQGVGPNELWYKFAPFLHLGKIYE